jgi:hypothetical protein
MSREVLITVESQHQGRMAALALRIRDALREGKRVAMFSRGKLVRVIGVSEPPVKPEVKP